MSEDALSRRSFLRRAGVVGAAAAGATVLAACGGGATSTEGGGEAASDAGGDAAAGSDLSCNDLSALTETEVTTRDSLQYAEVSTTDGQNCTNCEQYEAAGEGECGTCLVVPGPINPEGWCSVWVEKVS